MADLQKLVDEISTLTLLEASELVSMLESKLGVTAAAPMAMGMMPQAAAAAAPAEPEEEQLYFDVIIKDVGPKKIEVIKVVRKYNSNLGLKEAKDLVDSAPATLLEGVNKESAEDAKKALEEAGAAVELK